MQTASNGTFGHCPESASHHTMLKLTCETFWPLKDLDTFTATFVALEACLLPPIQEAHRIGTYCHIGISEKKKVEKSAPSSHVLEEAVQFLLPFYPLFWPEERASLQDFQLFAAPFSSLFCMNSDSDVSSQQLYLGMLPFCVERPCRTSLFQLVELLPLLHAASIW